jgi:hypothetical protein
MDIKKPQNADFKSVKKLRKQHSNKLEAEN